jgi:hypothetical protein
MFGCPECGEEMKYDAVNRQCYVCGYSMPIPSRLEQIVGEFIDFWRRTLHI